jgi:hypothetical protein
MSARFTLDVPSFERLLAAAWVLQCQRDELPSNASAHAVGVESQIQNSEVDSHVCSEHPLQEKDAGVEEQRAVCEVADLGPPLPAVAFSEKQEVAGALVLADGPNCLPAPDPASTARIGEVAADSRNHALLRAIGRVNALSPAAQKRKKNGLPITLRLVIPERSMVILRASVVPVLLLLTMAGFLLSLPFSQRAAQASQRAGIKGIQAALRASLQNNKISYTGPARIDHDGVGAEPGATPMEPSHLRITDPATAAVVNDLSPYEIQGLQRQAQYGDQFAALALGMAYETGHYVHRSCTKAAEWIAFAASSGNAAAQYNLALRYFEGDGLPQDSQEGNKWLRIAAAHGYPKPALAAETR